MKLRKLVVPALLLLLVVLVATRWPQQNNTNPELAAEARTATTLVPTSTPTVAAVPETQSSAPSVAAEIPVDEASYKAFMAEQKANPAAFNCPDGRNDYPPRFETVPKYRFTPCPNGYALLSVQPDGQLKLLFSSDPTVSVVQAGAQDTVAANPAAAFTVVSKPDAGSENPASERHTATYLPGDGVQAYKFFSRRIEANGVYAPWRLVSNTTDPQVLNAPQSKVEIAMTWTDSRKPAADLGLKFVWKLYSGGPYIALEEAPR